MEASIGFEPMCRCFAGRTLAARATGYWGDARGSNSARCVHNAVPRHKACNTMLAPQVGIEPTPFCFGGSRATFARRRANAGYSSGVLSHHSGWEQKMNWSQPRDSNAEAARFELARYACSRQAGTARLIPHGSRSGPCADYQSR